MSNRPCTTNVKQLDPSIEISAYSHPISCNTCRSDSGISTVSCRIKCYILAVPFVNVLPFWVIAILSPLLKVTVRPPLTSFSAVRIAFTLKMTHPLAASLIACSLMVNVTSLHHCFGL